MIDGKRKRRGGKMRKELNDRREKKEWRGGKMRKKLNDRQEKKDWLGGKMRRAEITRDRQKADWMGGNMKRRAEIQRENWMSDTEKVKKRLER